MKHTTCMIIVYKHDFTLKYIIVKLYEQITNYQSKFYILQHNLQIRTLVYDVRTSVRSQCVIQGDYHHGVCVTRQLGHYVLEEN